MFQSNMSSSHIRTLLRDAHQINSSILELQILSRNLKSHSKTTETEERIKDMDDAQTNFLNGCQILSSISDAMHLAHLLNSFNSFGFHFLKNWFLYSLFSFFFQLFEIVVDLARYTKLS